jgi:hypothetical protein
MSNRKKFGEILLEMGVISESDLNNALSRQRVSKKPLGQVFEELGVICDEDILQILAQQFNLKRVEEIGRPPVPKEALEMVDAQTALGSLIFPLGINNDGVAKSPSYGVAALFQDFDILYVCLHP